MTTSNFQPLRPPCRMCKTQISLMTFAINDLGEMKVKVTCPNCDAETEVYYCYSDLKAWVQKPIPAVVPRIDYEQYLLEVVLTGPYM